MVVPRPASQRREAGFLFSAGRDAGASHGVIAGFLPVFAFNLPLLLPDPSTPSTIPANGRIFMPIDSVKLSPHSHVLFLLFYVYLRKFSCARALEEWRQRENAGNSSLDFVDGFV